LAFDLSFICCGFAGGEIDYRVHVGRFQIIIASIMCGYSKEDWFELAQMAEVLYDKFDVRL